MKDFQSNWTTLVRPKKVVKDEKTVTPFYSKFNFEPLERGYGVTVGNAMRRVLLSSLQGPAITAVKIGGVLHEFSSISGVAEDVSEILMNFKGVNFKANTPDMQVLELSFQGPGEIKASDIQSTNNMQVLNGDHYIATVSTKTKVEMSLVVETGRGYQPVEEREAPRSMGEEYLPVDAFFSPVTKVNYSIKNARVGRKTDYENLVLEIWTKGSVVPEDALAYAAKIITHQLKRFINFSDQGVDLEESEETYTIKGDEEILFTPLDEVDFSVRSLNCLTSANMEYVGDLVQKSESELLNLPSFGKSSLEDVLKKLKTLSPQMSLDMNINQEIYNRVKESRAKP
ncbi:MAG: DNA-directed RNA polymerase subunit alpha [Candidatus Dadabacteria bacterium]|nr:DNA-directed RNA polymerase subunit alpha [Candidatus Dadabacteria bacterium]